MIKQAQGHKPRSCRNQLIGANSRSQHQRRVLNRYRQRLEALPDPRSPQGRIYPLACLVAIAVCAFTAAGNDRFTAVGQ